MGKAETQYNFFKNVNLDNDGNLGVSIQSSDALTNRIIVNQDNYVSILGGVIDSTKEYFIDGVIDLGIIISCLNLKRL